MKERISRIVKDRGGNPGTPMGWVLGVSALAILSGGGTTLAQPRAEARQRKEGAILRADSETAVPPTRGEYRGHRWHVDEDHRMWWDGKPYVRFGFTGNGNLAQMLQAGFDQFTLMPDEQWPIEGPDPQIVQRVDETSEQLEKAGATYYASLNAFWPWRYGSLIAESDKAEVFVRHVRDVTEHAGHERAVEVQVHLPVPPPERDRVKPVLTDAVLFDLERGTRHDLSGDLESVVEVVTEPGPDAQHEKEGERRGGKAFRIRLRPVRFPESHSLRLVLAMEVRVAELPGANGLPPLWKPGIRAFYRRSLEAFRPAYAKPGLRGLQFGDEINVFHQPLLTARTYLDLRQDAAALGAYRDWLARRVGSIQELNRQFGAGYTSFDEVPWRVPLHPYTPELARTDAAAEREESWAGAQTWGFADTVEQVRTISRVQNEFRVWFYGHWLAEYAKLAKEIIGPVPVFVCSAAIGGEADQYLALHRWALREGVDGLIRNHYGHGGEEERYALASLARWMASVQQESGGTKHLWANEIGYVHPRVTDDEWAAKEASERGSGASFGSQWAFPSRESLREMLLLLSRYGYRGFNRFLMNPSAPRAVREVEWMADLRKEIVPYVAAARPAGRVPEEPAPPGMGLGFPMQNTALGGPFQPRNHRQDADATPARAAKATPPAAQQLGVPMKVGPAQIVDYVDPTYGAKIRQLRKDDGHEHNFYYYRDPWNADGSRMLAIQSDLEQKNWRVCLYDGEGVFLKELFPIEKYDWRLCWDRNDPNLLYTWKGSDLFRFRVSDGEAELLKSFAPLGLKPNGPSCNQAGDRILVITSDNVFRSYRLPEMDEERTFKINVPEGCFVGWDKPHYIGYRNYIDTAYRGADPSQQAIVVHDDTGAVVHKFDAMGGGGHYDFSPDGKLAYFKLPTGGRGAPETPFEIHIVNLDGSGDRVLFRVPRRQAHFHNLHLSWPSRVNDWFVAGFFPSTPSSSGQTRYEPPFDEILLIRLDGTTQYLARTGTVYSAPAGRGKAGDMFWAQTLPSPSADGQRICFNSNRSGTIDLHILFLDATGN